MLTRVMGYLLLAGAALALPSDSEPPARGGAAESALEEFVPTERLPVDSAIRFPVDI